MELITSNKGTRKLCFDGFSYTVHKTCKRKISWRCSQYSSNKCRAALETTLDSTDPVLTKDHNHALDTKKVDAIIAVAKMKAVARETSTQPSQIFAQGVRPLSDATRAKLPVEESVRRTLRNQRKHNAPKNPESLQELEIEGCWISTGESEERRFLLWDNGTDADERIIVFATDDMLQLLDNAEEWWMDGTFEVSPSLFIQLYVLRVSVNGSFVTVAYSLLERKTKATYEELLQTIIDECHHREVFPDPKIIHVDFEEAVMGAVKTVLGDEVRIQGCFYHLTQSTHRKVQKLGLQTAYLHDEPLSKFCGMLDGLAFLPETDVEAGLEYLRDLPPPMGEAGMALLNYFDATYVDSSTKEVRCRKNGPAATKIRRIAPKFPKDLWNVNQITKKGGDRTNNQTEGWNNRFRHIVGVAHPTIWVLIEKMRDENAVDATKIVQRNAGKIQNPKQRSDIINRQERLLNICNAYDQGEHTISSFLSAVSEIIRSRTVEAL